MYSSLSANSMKYNRYYNPRSQEKISPKYNKYQNNRYYNPSSNYLTETSCAEIQKVLRNDYFSRLQSVSVNNYPTKSKDSDEPNKKSTNFEINDRPMKYAAKQILFSNKIRNDNYNWIKNHPKKKKVNEIEKNISEQILSNIEDYKRDMDESGGRKEKLPTIKKVVRDYNPIHYDIGYIDEVENKFIKPYLSKDNIIYTDFIENKKSKAPFNFIIG